MRSPRRLLADGSYIAVSQVVMGGTSYLTFAVAGRVLSTPALALFASRWALINLLCLSIMIPTEIYAPQLVAVLGGDRDARITGLRLITTYGAIVAVVATLVTTVVALWQGTMDINHLGVPLFATGIVVASISRSSSIMEANFSRLLRVTITSSIANVLLLGVLLVTTRHSQFWSVPLVLFGGATFVVLAYRDMWAGVGFVIYPVQLLQKKSVKLKSVSRPILALTVTTGVSLGIDNLGTIVGAGLGVSESALVAYSACISLVLAPMAILNSFSPPLLTRAITHVRAGQYTELKDLARKSLSVYLSLVLTLSLIFWPIGNGLIAVFVGGHYQLPARLMVVLALGIGMSTVNVIPRIMATAVSDDANFARIWIAALVGFLLCVIAPGDPLVRICIAPMVASGIALFLGVVRLFRRIDSLASDSIANE